LRLWLAAAGSVLVLGLLFLSVFLAQRGELLAAKIFALVAVTLVHLWSSIECMFTLLEVWKFLKTWGLKHGYNLLLFVPLQIISLLPIACWVMIREDDYRKFLAVSLRQCSCWFVLTTADFVLHVFTRGVCLVWLYLL
jgi:hypothetical protein